MKRRINRTRRAKSRVFSHMRTRPCLLAILDKTPDALFLSDDEARHVDANPAACKLTGYSRAQLLKRTVWDIMKVPHGEDGRQWWSTLLATGRHGDEHLLIRRDGSTLAVDYRSVANILPGLHLISMWDISGPKRAEEMLRKIAEDYRALIANIPDVIWTANARRDLSFISSNVRTICGYSPEEIRQGAGKLWFDRIHPDDMASVVDAYALLFREARAFDVEYRFQCRDGRWIWLHDRAISVRGHEGELWANGAFSDITARKEVENALEFANAELLRRNQELEQFVYTVSHDLKSPIVTIHGYLEHARHDVEQKRTDRLPDRLNRIEEATKRMRHHIDDFLELSRTGRSAREPQTINVEALVRDVIESHADEIQQLGVTVRVEPELPALFADRALIVEVFDNLLSNALKYGCSSPDPTIEFGGLKRNNEVRFFVRDNGPGIPKDCHERVFGFFERLNSQGEGAGVGLTIVRHSVMAHGGRVWVESDPGRGATFWIALPDRTEVTAQSKTGLGLANAVLEVR